MNQNDNQGSLVPKNKGAMAVPDHIKPSMQGRENVDSTDMVLARLRLSQYMSDWVKSGEGKAGDMVHSMSPSINWGSSVRIIPINFFKSRLRWTPRDETPPPDSPKGMECVANDAKIARQPRGLTKDNKSTDVCEDCVYSDFHDGKPPVCTLYKTFVAFVGPDLTLMAVSMEKTKLKAADNLNTFSSMLGGGNLPLYAGAYILSTVEEKNDKGDFFVYKIEPAEYATAEEFTKAEDMYKTLKAKDVSVDQENPNSSEGSGDSEEPVNF